MTATRLDPGRADYWNELGRGRFLGQDYAGSRAAFAQAVQLAPYSPTFLSNLAITEAQLGATDPTVLATAIAHGRDAVAASPNDPNPHLVLAQIELKIAPDDALTEAAMTIVLFGTVQSADAEMAVKILGQLAETADPSVARRQLTRAVARRPVVELYLALAIADVRAGDLPAGRDDVTHAVAERPSDPDVRLAGARILRRGGDESGAAALAPPPRLVGLDRQCAPRNGEGRSSDGVTRPLCLRLLFASLDPLETGDAMGSLAVLEHYTIDGHALPVGTNVTYAAMTAVATFQLPALITMGPRAALDPGGLASRALDPGLLRRPDRAAARAVSRSAG